MVFLTHAKERLKEGKWHFVVNQPELCNRRYTLCSESPGNRCTGISATHARANDVQGVAGVRGGYAHRCRKLSQNENEATNTTSPWGTMRHRLFISKPHSSTVACASLAPCVSFIVFPVGPQPNDTAVTRSAGTMWPQENLCSRGMSSGRQSCCVSRSSGARVPLASTTLCAWSRISACFVLESSKMYLNATTPEAYPK